MVINTTNNDGTVTLSLSGWLDTMSAPELGEAVEKITEAKAIVMDFSQVEYMASAGLRQVVAAHKKAKSMEATFSVVHVRKEIMSIFRMTGIDKKLSITE